MIPFFKLGVLQILYFQVGSAEPRSAESPPTLPTGEQLGQAGAWRSGGCHDQAGIFLVAYCLSHSFKSLTVVQSRMASMRSSSLLSR